MKRVLGRHQHLQPSLEAYALTILPAADGFMDTYDRLRTLTATRGQELMQGKLSVAVVVDKMASWVVQVAAIGGIDQFNAADFGDSPSVPDDVISDAEALVDIVAKHEELNPGSIPFVQALIDDLTPAIETAKTEWAEADGLKSEHQALVTQNRENAKQFSSLLVAFRKSLARALGRNHPDYQTLRSTKIDRNVLEEGEEADLPPELIPPAPSTDASDTQDTAAAQ